MFHRCFRQLLVLSPVCLVLAAFYPVNSFGFEYADSDDVAARYTVDLADAKNHYITVTADLETDQESTELMMAVWTPGSYLVREYARNIDSMTVTSDGQPVDFEKVRKNRWRVKTDGIKEIQVRYRVYCNEISVRTNFVGKQYAMLNGAPTFITVPGRLDQKHFVQLKMPKPWTRSATSLRQTGESPHLYVAENFDELVDSPIVAGNVRVYPFSVGGVEHQLVNVGESGYWDGTKAATDLKRVVEAHQEMWEVVPYDRYLFLNVIAESGGGLEHDNSCLIMTSRWSFREPRRYQGWLSLASHEFFHTWNVRRLRPKPLVNYDYENEVYTDGLWIAEGITSYYQDLALVRAGFASRSDFLGKLSRGVEGLQRTGGRRLQSLKESSFDAWIKYYRPDENSSNTRISYYSKGAVVAFLLDAKIRKLTNGDKSLDDVMRSMFTQFSESGFTSDEFRQTASNIAGQDLTDWFSSTIDSTDELDYSDIDALGIVVPNRKDESATSDALESVNSSEGTQQKEDNPKPAKAGEKKTDDVDAKTSERESDGQEPKKTKPKPPSSESAKKTVTNKSSNRKPWLGISTSSSDGKITITSVKPNSPGYDVGLNIDDEVIAINGFRLTRSVDSRLSQYDVGDKIDVLIARRGKLINLEVEVGYLESESWRLKFERRPTDEQKEQQKNWLSISGAAKPTPGSDAAEPNKSE